ncbi:MAG: uracil phosphoribosyltransferase [Aquificaceae bacterium]|nr:uracil phosphoribosyltransferase [Aquificaceae bacterium]MDW8423460.1 uracil phosphoribosyltransferase [Aquificaceae bacterium]
MALKILDNALLSHKINLIRNKHASSEEIRRAVEDVTVISLSHMAQLFPGEEREIETPMGNYTFEFIMEEKIVFVCVLRAGIPMLNGALRALPKAKAGFVAIKRDEETLMPKLYYWRLPDLTNKFVVVLDPMLATGGTLSLTIDRLKEAKPERIMSLNLVASPEGLERLLSSHPDVDFFVVRVDRGLNKKGYIVPGVGDLGDRLFSEGL